MRKLNQLVDCPYDIDIIGISDDSRNIKEGYLFIATKGYFVDHFYYIDDAISRGASAIVCDREIDVDIASIVVCDVNASYVEICQKFYGVSPDEFNLVGVTGTDGKTTTTTIIHQLLTPLEKTALIGTNGAYVDDFHISTNNTTPCVSELYEVLNSAKNSECKSIIMEVSSEALLHDRLKDFKYDVVGYTNITEDHLNIHKTIENYRNSKLKLLKLVKQNGIVVFNGDDNNCKYIKCKNMYSYGMNSDNDFVISDVKEMSNFVKFTIQSNGVRYEIKSPFKEKYNIYNVTLAFIICLLKGIDANYLISRIKKLKPISGRGEIIDFGQEYKIVLDYAHTLNGINNILDSVKEYKKIITVTGAAGGREKEKRRKIGSLVLDKSDIVIFTMDDPRYEDPNDIIDEMVLDSDKSYLRIIDREDAISKALSLATADSVVLILGKGRDNYMAIDDKKIPYSDYDTLKKHFFS